MKIKFCFIVLFFNFLIFSISFASEQKEIYGTELSDYVYKTISKINLPFWQSPLSPYNASNYPQNLIVCFEKSDEKTECPIENLYFVFSHYYFFQNTEFCMNLLNLNKEKKFPFNRYFLFCSDNDYLTSPSLPSSITTSGIQNYADQIYETSSSAVICIEDNLTTSDYAITENNDITSPMWLIKSIFEAYNDYHVNLKIKPDFMSFFDIYFRNENSKTSCFLNNQIPAAGIYIPPTEKGLEITSRIMEKITEVHDTKWNSHYQIISIFNSPKLWLNEELIVLIYVMLLFSILSTLCFSSFINNSQNNAVFKDLSKTWFFIPLIILICFFALELSQKFFIFFEEQPLIFFYLKISFSLVILFSITMIHVYSGIFVSFLANSFFLMIICVLNLLVFSTANISMMEIFVFQYLVCFIFRKTRSRFSNIICFILLFLPLAWIIYYVFNYSFKIEFINLHLSSIKQNLLYACIIVPFILQFENLVLVFHIINLTLKNKKELFTALGICISIWLIASFIITLSLKNKATNQNLNYFIPEEDTNDITIECSESINNDIKNNKLIIKSADSKIFRTYLTLFCNGSIPLYECNFNYDISSQNLADIDIPDFPRKNIEVLFSNSNKSEVTAFAIIYYISDNSIKKTSRQITIGNSK